MRCANSEALNNYMLDQEENDKLIQTLELIEDNEEKEYEQKIKEFTSNMYATFIDDYEQLIRNIDELAINEHDLNLSFEELEELMYEFMSYRNSTTLLKNIVSQKIENEMQKEKE